MKRFRHPLFSLFLALLLVGAQQAAFAHLIAHFGVGTETVAKHEDDGHGAALTLSHVCTTCIAFAALDGPPAAPQLPSVAADIGETFVAGVSSIPPVRRVLVLRARGPPQDLPV